MLFDAHFHYPVCMDNNVYDIPQSFSYASLSCSHSIEEWNVQLSSPIFIYHAFGIHPQLVGILEKENKLETYKQLMESLCKEGKLDAIGEAGFDLFTEDFKASKEKQEEIFLFELFLCQKYNLPIVIHCRKGNEYLFKYSGELKKIKSVLFHSFMGSLTEANSLIKRGINCFFSFGKQLLNNNKKVIDCVKHLPLSSLLLETDAPFQTLKGEEYTTACEIEKVYKASYELRKEENQSFLSYEEYEKAIYANAKRFLPLLK